MKRRGKLILLLILGIMIVLSIYYRPQNLGTNLYKDKPLEINYSKAYFDPVTHQLNTHEKKVIIEPTDEIYDDVFYLLSNSYYHHSILSYFTHNNPQHELFDTFIIRNIEVEPYLGDMIVYSNGKCEFYKKHVKLGYFSNKSAKKLCSELKRLLVIKSP